MMLVTQRRGRGGAAGLRTVGGRGHLRYAAVYHRGTSPVHGFRPSGGWIRTTWWNRLADDHDMIGLKLLALAALLALTAALERVV